MVASIAEMPLTASVRSLDTAESAHGGLTGPVVFLSGFFFFQLILSASRLRSEGTVPRNGGGRIRPVGLAKVTEAEEEGGFSAYIPTYIPPTYSLT